VKFLNGLKNAKMFGRRLKIDMYKPSILISPNWELEFHVHTNESQLTLGAILA
jgi:hypothetical protein